MANLQDDGQIDGTSRQPSPQPAVTGAVRGFEPADTCWCHLAKSRSDLLVQQQRYWWNGGVPVWLHTARVGMWRCSCLTQHVLVCGGVPVLHSTCWYVAVFLSYTARVGMWRCSCLTQHVLVCGGVPGCTQHVLVCGGVPVLHSTCWYVAVFLSYPARVGMWRCSWLYTARVGMWRCSCLTQHVLVCGGVPVLHSTCWYVAVFLSYTARVGMWRGSCLAAHST